MKIKKIKAATKVYKRKCKELNILIYYRMLLQRISCHLSPEEVSFLMGKPLDFMSKIETFRIKTIFIQDLYTLHFVLEVNNVNSMIHMGAGISRQKSDYELRVTKLADRVTYEMYRFDIEQGQQVLEFKLIDIRHDIDPYENSTAEEVKKIRVLLDEKIDAGYFNEERRPNEIHKSCCDKLDEYVRPKNLMLVLDELLQRNEGEGIARKRSECGFAYVLAASEKSDEQK